MEELLIFYKMTEEDFEENLRLYDITKERQIELMKDLKSALEEFDLDNYIKDYVINTFNKSDKFKADFNYPNAHLGDYSKCYFHMDLIKDYYLERDSFLENLYFSKAKIETFEDNLRRNIEYEFNKIIEKIGNNIEESNLVSEKFQDSSFYYFIKYRYENLDLNNFRKYVK